MLKTYPDAMKFDLLSNATLENISEKEISGVAGVTEVTLRNRFNG
jgi:hypothetical protein